MANELNKYSKTLTQDATQPEPSTREIQPRNLGQKIHQGCLQQRYQTQEVAQLGRD